MTYPISMVGSMDHFISNHFVTEILYFKVYSEMSTIFWILLADLYFFFKSVLYSFVVHTYISQYTLWKFPGGLSDLGEDIGEPFFFLVLILSLAHIAQLECGAWKIGLFRSLTNRVNGETYVTEGNHTFYLKNHQSYNEKLPKKNGKMTRLIIKIIFQKFQISDNTRFSQPKYHIPRWQTVTGS